MSSIILYIHFAIFNTKVVDGVEVCILFWIIIVVVIGNPYKVIRSSSRYKTYAQSQNKKIIIVLIK